MADSKPSSSSPSDSTPKPRGSAISTTVSQALVSGDTSLSEISPLAGTSLPSESMPFPSTFGRYRIVSQLGKGAMGVVYLAEDMQLGRKVALKIPNRSALETPEAVERFHREARTTATLKHANICQVYDVGEIDGSPYLTMEWVHGKTIDNYIRKSKLPNPHQVAKLIRKIALTLEEAHKQGIIHRDLKPSNIMLDERGEPKVMDFGLARNVNTAEHARLTQSGSILGTPAYMAPEQVRGDQRAIGPQTDVYALGVILYQFLTGELPFNGVVGVVFTQILTSLPARPADLNPHVDPALESICRKMMSKEIGERYQSMKQVADALTEHLKPGMSFTVDPTPTEPSPADPTTATIAAATTTVPEFDFARLAEVPSGSSIHLMKAKSGTKPDEKSAGKPRRRFIAYAAAACALIAIILLAIPYMRPARDATHPNERDRVETLADSASEDVDGQQKSKSRPAIATLEPRSKGAPVGPKALGYFQPEMTGKEKPSYVGVVISVPRRLLMPTAAEFEEILKQDREREDNSENKTKEQSPKSRTRILVFKPSQFQLEFAGGKKQQAECLLLTGKQSENSRPLVIVGSMTQSKEDEFDKDELLTFCLGVARTDDELGRPIRLSHGKDFSVDVPSQSFTLANLPQSDELAITMPKINIPINIPINISPPKITIPSPTFTPPKITTSDISKLPSGTETNGPETKAKTSKTKPQATSKKPAPPKESPKPRETDPEKIASSRLRLAKNLLESNKSGAIKRLEEIIEEFPETSAAKEAQALLKGE